MHWFCFWVGNYPLSVWLLKPSIIPFFPRYKDVEDHRACCYLVLICVKLWRATLCSCHVCLRHVICILICRKYVCYLEYERVMYCIHLSRFVRPCEPPSVRSMSFKLNIVSFTFFDIWLVVYSGRCDPLSCDSGVWPLSFEKIYICIAL